MPPFFAMKNKLDFIQRNTNRNLIKHGSETVGLRVQRSAEIKAVRMTDEGDSVYRFVITSNTPDRYNDIVEAQGGDFTHYMRNPVVFYNHNTHGDMLPIGKCLSFEVQDNKIIAEVVFDKEDEFACRIESKIARGYLNAVSIGFIPLEGYECSPNDLGLDSSTLRPISNTVGVYTKWEIIEFSVVGIPANTDALLVNNSYDNKTNKTFMNNTKIKALESTDVEEFIATATGEFKKVILKLLQDYNLDFSTTDVATVAGEFANSVVSAFGGSVESEPAPEAAPMEPASTEPQTMAYEFKDELDFFLQLKEAHKNELDMCSAAMNIPDLTENGLELISNLATVLPEEIENLHEHVLTLEGKAPAEGEGEEGEEPMPMMDNYKKLNDVFLQRAGAAISAKTRQLLQQMYEHQEQAEEMNKRAKKICRELIESNKKEEPTPEMAYNEQEAIEAIEDALKNELSFI